MLIILFWLIKSWIRGQPTGIACSAGTTVGCFLLADGKAADRPATPASGRWQNVRSRRPAVQGRVPEIDYSFLLKNWRKYIFYLGKGVDSGEFVGAQRSPDRLLASLHQPLDSEAGGQSEQIQLAFG
jgi:hypothetical protein